MPAPRMRESGTGRFKATCPCHPAVFSTRSRPRTADATRRRLFDGDLSAGVFEFLLPLLGVFLVDAFEEGLGRLVDHGLGFLEAQVAAGFADDLDDLELVGPAALDDDVELGLDL